MAQRIEAALARHEAEIERADARRRRMQNAKAVPALLDAAERDGGLGRLREDRLRRPAAPSAPCPTRSSGRSFCAGA